MSSFLAKMAIGVATVFVGIGTVLGEQGQHGLFKRQTHFRADAGGRVPLWSLVATRGVFQCIEACTGDPRCMSVLYNSETKACLLHAEHVSSAQDSIAPADWQLWERQVDDHPCPALRGYIFRPDMGWWCYKIHHDKIEKWFDAKKTCEAEGGHLLIVDSQEKQDHMVAELEKIEGNTTFGTGAAQGFYLDGFYSEGEWTWSSTGQTLGFSAWFGTQFEVKQNREIVIMMSRGKSYLWKSASYLYRRPFVCEIDMPGPPICRK